MTREDPRVGGKGSQQIPASFLVETSGGHGLSPKQGQVNDDAVAYPARVATGEEIGISLRAAAIPTRERMP